MVGAWSARAARASPRSTTSTSSSADGEPRHYGTARADYQTDALTRDYALPYIDAQAIDPGPFFLWLAYHPPHSGSVATTPPAGAAPTARRAIARAASRARSRRRATRVATCAPALRARPRSTSATSPTSRSWSAAGRRSIDADLETIERDYRCGLAALRALDDGVGEIVVRAAPSGQLESTVLVFLADQGVMAGEHRIKRGKNLPYEEAIGIPLLIRGPGIVPGRRDRGPGRQRRPRADDPRPRRRERSRPSWRARSTAARWRRARRRLRAVRPGGPDRGSRQRRQVAPRLQGPLLRRGAHRALRVHRAPAGQLRRPRRRASPLRSAPGGRPSASSTTSPATRASCASRDRDPALRGRPDRELAGLLAPARALRGRRVRGHRGCPAGEAVESTIRAEHWPRYLRARCLLAGK